MPVVNGKELWAMSSWEGKFLTILRFFNSTESFFLIFAYRYQMSLSAWNWVDNRNDFLDFVPVNKDSEILCLIPKPPEVDPGLFIRPFRDEVWKGIGVLLTIGFIMFFLPFLWWEDWDDWMSNNLIEFSIWFFFVLINAYYGGALTMFFVSEVTIPFNTITDVLTIFPTWNLVFIDGNQNYFKTPASQVHT